MAVEKNEGADHLNLNPDQRKALDVQQKVGEITGILKEFELFGDNIPKGEFSLWGPINVLQEMQHIAALSSYKKGSARELGERIKPLRKPLKNIELAYGVIAYSELRNTGFGLEAWDLARDAQENHGIDTENNPHRDTIVLDDAEAIVLGNIARSSGLQFDPDQREYSHADLLPRPSVKR